jgi:hypothetical protein
MTADLNLKIEAGKIENCPMLRGPFFLYREAICSIENNLNAFAAKFSNPNIHNLTY